MKKINYKYLIFCLVWCAQLHAISSVPSLNECPDMVFIDGNENASVPSNGSGGSFPGSIERTVFVSASLGSHLYYIYIPSGYLPSEPLPMMVVWHGQAGAGNAALAAQDMRLLWQAEAEARNVIIVAQVATGTTSGSWVPSNDFQIFSAILDDMQASYNIEESRIYVWGFSAGGHVMHAIALSNTAFFAAYAVNSGDLVFSIGSNILPSNAPRKLPVYVSVGSSDFIEPQAQNDRNTFLAAGWQEGQNYWLDVFPGGHVLPNDAPSKAWNKICISTNLD